MEIGFLLLLLFFGAAIGLILNELLLMLAASMNDSGKLNPWKVLLCGLTALLAVYGICLTKPATPPIAVIGAFIGIAVSGIRFARFVEKKTKRG